MNNSDIEHFLHTQVGCWNAGDNAGFMAAYRQVAEGGLTIEYVGREPADGWAVLEAMWERQHAAVEIEEVQVIINGNEAACHNRNKIKGTDKAVETIELYRFDPGQRLSVRYFIRQP
jgi:ketosteroid isomerase-like protein